MSAICGGQNDTVGFLHDLTDTHPQAMKRLRELRKCPIQEGAPGLVEMLRHASHEVRGAAARALGTARWEPAAPDLAERLEDEHPHVIAWAAEALGRIGSREAVPALERVLQGHYSTARIYATQALRRIHHRSAVPALIAALDDSSWAVFDEAKEALEALIQPEDREPLEQAARRLGRLRRWRLRSVFSKLPQRAASAA